MKPTSHFIRSLCLFISGMIVLFIAGAVSAAVSLTVTPSSVTNTYLRQITLQITGVTNGETVTIEKYVDIAGNGAVDAGDFILQSFKVTDGQVTTINGVKNRNVPGDNDGATNGQMQVNLNFAAENESASGSGKFIYRASGSSGSATAPFAVTQMSYPQHIMGKVFSNGVPVGGAFVALLQPRGQDANYVTGTFTDATGNYSLTNPPGTYVVLPLSPGLIANFGTTPLVTLNPGQTVTTNLNPGTATTRTISGRCVNAANTNAGLRNLQLFVQDQSGDVTVGFTDSQGNFNLPVTANRWNIQASEASLNHLGYLGLRNDTSADASAGNVSGLTLGFTKGTALIFGSIKDAQNNPLAAVRFSAQDGNHQFETHPFSGTNGNYSAAVTAGTWDLSPSNEKNPVLAGYVMGSSNSVFTLTDGQTLLANFVAQRTNALILGSVRDSGGNPIANMGVFAYATISNLNYNLNTPTDTNGNFSLGVINGTWSVGVSCSGDNGLSSLGYNCVGNQSVVISGANGTASFVVSAPTAHLTGRAIDDTGGPVANMTIFAFLGGGGSSAQTDTDGSGNFDLGVNAGSWTVEMNTDPQSGVGALGLVSPFLNIPNLLDGETRSNLVLVCRHTNAIIVVSVRDNHGNPVAGVSVSAYSLQSGTNYSTGNTPTDDTGDMSLSVFRGIWQVTVSCFELATRGYACPDGQPVVLLGANGTADFVLQPVNPVPVLGSAVRLLDGRFQFTVSGGPGPIYTVQASTNLTFSNWVTLLVTTNPAGGSFGFMDTQAPGLRQRFYRVLSGP